ncbi:hypothetical protein JTB14_026710 [Gonioctena quinquepunctata]|nr:hypothetical protein JTB14_026710 [Gonioctena quinquepunctata]
MFNQRSPADEAARKNFYQQDNKAKSIIIQCVVDSHLEYVREDTTEKEKWFKLVSTFERQVVSNRLLFVKQLLTMNYNVEESMEGHIVKFYDTVRCNQIGHVQYNCPNKKLRKHFQKRHNANMSEDCQERGDARQNFPDDAEGVAFMVNNSSSSSKYNKLSRMIWYVDSGASAHLSNNIQVVEDVKELEKIMKIGVAKSGEDLEGTHVGSIRVSNNVDGRIHSYTLLDVMHVPNLRKNSLSQILTLHEVDFGVNLRLSESYICSRNENMLWHRRLGHLNSHFSKKLQNFSDGMVFDNGVEPNISDLTNLFTQVSHSTETYDSTFEEKGRIDTETKALENVSPVTDEVDANRERNQENKCSSRSRQPRLWLKNYEVNYVAESSNNIFSIAYSTEPFMNDLPRSIDNVRSHPDRKQWEAEMMKELKPSEENRTWTLVSRTEKHKTIEPSTMADGDNGVETVTCVEDPTKEFVYAGDSALVDSFHD